MSQPVAFHRPIVRLEVFFDLSCPFTLIAKTRLKRLLALARTSIELTWTPRILHPSIPAGGVDFHAAHRERYGEQSGPLQERVEALMREVGLRFENARLKKVPNTLDAHRTVRFAATAGLASEMIEAILRAYFLEYRDIGDRHVLTELVAAMGLDAADFRARLASDWQRAEVLAADAGAVFRGARTVPSYRLNGVLIENTADVIAELEARLAPSVSM